MTEDDALIEKARSLAADCRSAKVNKNEVQQILGHLRRRRDLPATLKLLKSLPKSCFNRGDFKLQKRLEALGTHVGSALRGQPDWLQAARLLGWTCRFLVVLEHEGRKNRKW